MSSDVDPETKMQADQAYLMAARELLEAYYEEKTDQVGSRNYKRYALGKHENTIEELLAKEPSALSGGEMKTLLNAAGKAFDEKGLRDDAGPTFQAAQDKFEDISEQYLTMIGAEAGGDPVDAAIKEAKPPGFLAAAWGGVSGMVGGAASSSWSYLTSKNPLEIAGDIGGNIWGGAKYMFSNPYEATTLMLQGTANGLASTVALVPAAFKVAVNNNPVTWIGNGVQYLRGEPQIPKWTTDFNKMFTDFSNGQIVGNTIRTVSFVNPFSWGHAYKLSTDTEYREENPLFTDKGIVAQIKLDQGGSLEGAQKFVLFGSQAVAEVGAFIAVSVPTFGAGGAALAWGRGGSIAAQRAATLARATNAAAKVNLPGRFSWAAAKEGYAEASKFGWKIMRPYTSRMQRAEEASELGLARLTAGQAHAAKYEGSSGLAKWWHGVRANRFLGSAPEGTISPAWNGTRNARLPSWVPGFKGGPKDGIAFESMGTAMRYGRDATTYRALFSGAAENGASRFFRNAAERSPRLPFPISPNFGISDRFRRYALSNPDAFTSSNWAVNFLKLPFRSSANTVRDGGAVLGWAGGMEVAGMGLSYTMNSAADGAEDSRTDQTADNVEQGVSDQVSGARRGGATEDTAPEGDNRSALPADVQQAGLSNIYTQMGLNESSAQALEANNVFQALAFRTAQTQFMARGGEVADQTLNTPTAV